MGVEDLEDIVRGEGPLHEADGEGAGVDGVEVVGLAGGIGTGSEVAEVELLHLAIDPAVLDLGVDDAVAATMLADKGHMVDIGH